jgi:hypothetical protein
MTPWLKAMYTQPAAIPPDLHAHIRGFRASLTSVQYQKVLNDMQRAVSALPAASFTGGQGRG